MAEYIEREAALKIIDNYSKTVEANGKQVVKAVRDIVNFICPTADVQEVRHGKWILLNECANEGIYCSACHKKVYQTDYANQKLKSNYCPNCGAKLYEE